MEVEGWEPAPEGPYFPICEMEMEMLIVLRSWQRRPPGRLITEPG